jgi:hypothetical protein
VSVHADPHPLASQPVTLLMGGARFRVEDWWDRVSGSSWTEASIAGNPAARAYAIRIDGSSIPADDEVLYGKVGAYGVLVHTSEIRTEPEVAR